MCGTGKRGYPNGAAAMREARKLRRNNRGTNDLRCYRCPHCHEFHLANSIQRRASNPHLRRYRDLRAELQAE